MASLLNIAYKASYSHITLTPHTTTQETPCKPFLGRSIRTRLDLVHSRCIWTSMHETEALHARETKFVKGGT